MNVPADQVPAHRDSPASSPAVSGEPPFLEVRGIHKRFAGVHALRGVDLVIEGGQIYHLIGENGCGKSTLIKIIAGAQPPDEGEIVIEGRAYAYLSPIEALAAGIETVYQDFSLLPNLSVAENVALTQQLVRSRGRLFRRLDREAMESTAAAALAAIGLPNKREFMQQRVDTLPIATRQMVAIARSIASDARLVIMDEPTTALTKREVDNLISVVNRLRGQGVAVLFVTHKLDECKAIGGRVVIFRDGQKVMEGDTGDYDKAELSYWMTGRRLAETRYRHVPVGETARLDVEGLTRAGVFSEVSFSLRQGEILGVTGAVLGRLCSGFGLLDETRVRDLAHRLVGQLQIATPDIERPVQSLSGGNQQRVLLGRWLAIEPRLLILHGPTVGVDVGSKDTIYRIIQALAAQGMSILIVSDDLPELLQNCDRILVMRKGRIAHVFDATEISGTSDTSSAFETRLYEAMVAEQAEREEACVR